MPRKTAVNARKAPRQERSRQTVEAILGATSRVLVREGFAALTTTRVAEVAGVSIGSLYQYFPTKEALVGALVDEHIAKILALLAEATSRAANESFEDAIGTFVRTVLRIHAVDPDLHAELTQNFAHVEGFEKVRDLNARSIEIVRAYLAGQTRPLRPKNRELAAFIVVHAVQAVVSAAVRERAVARDDDELALELTALVLRFLT